MLSSPGIRSGAGEGLSYLVDIGLGVFLFAIGILGLGMSVMQVSGAKAGMDSSAFAGELAMEGIKLAHSSNGVQNFSISDYRMDRSGAGEVSGIQELQFKRTVTVTEFDGYRRGADRRVVTVKVEWHENGETRSLQLVSSTQDP